MQKIGPTNQAQALTQLEANVNVLQCVGKDKKICEQDLCKDSYSNDEGHYKRMNEDAFCMVMIELHTFINVGKLHFVHFIHLHCPV